MGRKVRLAVFVLALAGGYWLLRSKGAPAPETVASSRPTTPTELAGTTELTARPTSSPLVHPTTEGPRPAPSTAAPSEPARPESEEDFLRQLQSLHLTDKVAALEFARRGEDWYSDDGPLAEARKAMIATLLVDLDRVSEARAEVERFIERYPDSPHRPMLQGKTGIHPRPGAPESYRRSKDASAP